MRLFFPRAAALATVGALLFALDRLLYAGSGRPSSNAVAALWAMQAFWAAGIGLVGLVPSLAWRRSGRIFTGGANIPNPWTGALALAAVAFLPLFVVSRELTRGDWIARQWWAPAFFVGALAAGALGTVLLGRVYFGAHRARGVRRIALLLALTGAAAGAAVANARVLPGLYPSFHLLLQAVSTTFLLLAAVPFWEAILLPRRRWTSRIFGAIGVLAMLVSGALWAMTTLRTRSQIALASPIAALAMPYVSTGRSTSAVREELDRMDLAAPARPPARHQAEVGKLLGDRRKWNVVLVLVDTLRADTLPPARKAKGAAYVKKGDTPFLDGWLSKSYRFKVAYSQASRTKRSIPPTFRSIEAHEDVENMGVPLGEQARQLGLTSLAVVPEYFLQPAAERSQRLVLSFDRLAFYGHDSQEDLVTSAKGLIDGAKDPGFFAWLHFFNMHSPYYAGKLQKSADGGPPKRYRNALKWLDGQVKLLDQALDDAGVKQDTVVIFTADHGENLSEKRSGHGGTVYEGEVRVPLSIHIPGRPGGEIDAVVGNIDIVPTIVDLLGQEPNPMHAGRSLLPLVAGADAPRALPLYFESSEGVQGVAIDRQKLIHSDKTGFFQRFDLTADPTEDNDLFDPVAKIDRELLAAMLRKNPTLFTAELERSAVRRGVLEKLQSVGPNTPANADVELLFQLAALTKEREILAECERIFERTTDLELSLLATKYLFRADPAPWGALLAARIRGGDKAAVGALVNGLTRLGQPEFAPDVIAEQMLREGRSEPPSSWPAWLSLIRSWPKPASVFAEPLRVMFESFAKLKAAPENDRTLGLMLDAVAGLTTDPGTDVSGLTALVRPWLDTTSQTTVAKAANALATLRDPELGARLRNKIHDTSFDLRTRQTFMHALADVEGNAAVPVIVDLGKNPLLALDAIRIVSRLKSKEALPFLKSVSSTHYDGYTRSEAGSASREIQK